MSRISTWMNRQGCVFLSPLKCSSRYISLLLGIARAWQKQSNYSDISRILNDILPPYSTDFVSQQKKEWKLWLSKNFICSKCCLALLEISCQSNVSLHVCPQSISSFESYIHNSRQRNSILSEVLERVGLAGILGIMGALYRQPARITYAGLRSAWCNGREIRQTFGISLSWYPGILGNI